MKVLTVTVSIDARDGGKPERAIKIWKALAEAGVESSLLTLAHRASEERAQMLGSKSIHVIPVLGRRFFIPRMGFARIRDLVRSADVVQLFGHWAFLNVVVYLACRRFGVPYAICPAGELQYAGRVRSLKRVFDWVIGRAIVRHASGYIAVASSELPHFERYGIGAERVRITPNGIDPAEFVGVQGATFRACLGAEGRRLLFFLGRLHPIKGPDLLLDAFASIAATFSDVDLVFMGPDEGSEPGLRKTTEQHRLVDRVHFCGFTAGRARLEALAAADLIAVPSRSEAMSLVVIEAGALARPVLLTDRCGLNALMEDEVAVVVPASAEAIAAALAKLLSLPPAELCALGVRLKDYTLARFSWSNVVTPLATLFEEIATRSLRSSLEQGASSS